MTFKKYIILALMLSIMADTAMAKPAYYQVRSAASTTNQASSNRPLTSADYQKYACHREIRLAEMRYRIPIQLLESIAMMESRRYYAPAKRSIAWPWTVMAEGKGRYFDTKEQAIAEVRGLQKRGVRNIDVGCMQVNLMHHASAFKNLDDAFNPRTNVDYAARFLTDLKTRYRAWSTAVGNYHSATPERHYAYRNKVLAQWREARLGYTPAQRVDAQRELVRLRNDMMQQRQQSRLRIMSF